MHVPAKIARPPPLHTLFLHVTISIVVATTSAVAAAVTATAGEATRDKCQREKERHVVPVTCKKKHALDKKLVAPITSQFAKTEPPTNCVDAAAPPGRLEKVDSA